MANQNRRTVSLNRHVFEEAKRRSAEEERPLAEYVGATLLQQWAPIPEDSPEPDEEPMPERLLSARDGIAKVPQFKRLKAGKGDYIVNLDLVVEAKSPAKAMRMAQKFCVEHTKRAGDFMILSVEKP